MTKRGGRRIKKIGIISDKQKIRKQKIIMEKKARIRRKQRRKKKKITMIQKEGNRKQEEGRRGRMQRRN